MSIIIQSEFDNESRYQSHPPVDVGTQTIDGKFSPFKQLKRAIPSESESPQKRATTIKRTIIDNVSVVGLPGKTPPPVLPSSSASTTGKCKGCGIIFMSKKDEEYRKKYGKRVTEWVGCDRPRCKYWAHAKCAGMVLKPKVPVSNQPFLCEQYRLRK